MDKKKIKKIVFGLILALVLVALAVLAYQRFGGRDNSLLILAKPQLPLNADLRMHELFNIKGMTYAMAIGEEAKIKLRLNSKTDGLNTTARFVIPDGFEVIGGGEVWDGMVGVNDTLVEVLVRAMKVGVWNVSVNVTSSKGDLTGNVEPQIVLCVGVTRDGLKEKCMV